MRKYLIGQQGFTIVELMVAITLTMLLLPGMLHLFSTSITIWNIEKNRTSLQQTVRIAVDKVMSEIRYAQDISLDHPQALKITKLNGETNTFQLGGGLHGNTLYIIIDKTQAVPRGGISANPLTENVVTNLLFTPYPDPNNIEAMAITLEITDNKTGKRQSIQTAGFPWNRH